MSLILDHSKPYGLTAWVDAREGITFTLSCPERRLKELEEIQIPYEDLEELVEYVRRIRKLRDEKTEEEP